jgi:hypothetical protein
MSAVKDLLVVGQGMAEAGQETVHALAAIREADAHDRRLRRLRDVPALVGRINHMAQYTVLPQPEFRCSEQTELAGLLGGHEEELPKCKALASEGQSNQILGAGRQALAEVTAVLKRWHESG